MLTYLAYCMNFLHTKCIQMLRRHANWAPSYFVNLLCISCAYFLHYLMHISSYLCTFVHICAHFEKWKSIFVHICIFVHVSELDINWISQRLEKLWECKFWFKFRTQNKAYQVISTTYPNCAKLKPWHLTFGPQSNSSISVTWRGTSLVLEIGLLSLVLQIDQMLSKV